MMSAKFGPSSWAVCFSRQD